MCDRETRGDTHIHLFDPNKKRGQAGKQNIGGQSQAHLLKLTRKRCYQAVEWPDRRRDTRSDRRRNHPESGEIEMNNLADFGRVLVRNQGTEILVSRKRIRGDRTAHGEGVKVRLGALQWIVVILFKLRGISGDE